MIFILFLFPTQIDVFFSFLIVLLLWIWVFMVRLYNCFNLGDLYFLLLLLWLQLLLQVFNVVFIHIDFKGGKRIFIIQILIEKAEKRKERCWVFLLIYFVPPSWTLRQQLKVRHSRMKKTNFVLIVETNNLIALGNELEIDDPGKMIGNSKLAD